MRKLTIFLITLFVGLQIFAQQNSLLQKANEFYKQKEYSQAAELYEQALQKGVAPEIYYNLGNAYFKMGENGKAILNYERALRLAPNYSDAKANLRFVQTKIADEQQDVGAFFIIRWADRFIDLFPSNTWLFISVAAFVATLVCLMFFFFGNSLTTRKRAFYFTFILLIISILCFIFSGIQKNNLRSNSQAVIMNGAVTAKSSPDKSGTDLFVIHEGSTVSITSELGNWVEIKFGGSNVGWVENSMLERVNPVK